MRFIYTKTFAKIFTVFLILALFVILDITGYVGFFKDWILRSYGAAAVEVTAGSNGLKNAFNTIFTIKNLARDNATLNQRVDELSFENARLQAAGDENIALRKALNFQQQSKLNLFAVQALTLDPTGFTQTITIDKGAASGLTVDEPVVVAPGLLVGRITKVYQDASEVTLITDPSSVVNAEVVDSGARGLVRGEHGLSLLFDLVTQNELIKSGDSVVTSGLAQDYPRGLLIGEITALRSQPTDLFQKAYITPAADLRSLRFLFVILP